MIDKSAPLFFVYTVEPNEEEEGTYTDKEDISTQILSAVYTESEDKADTLELTVRNFEFENFDNPLWEPGTLLFYQFGYAGEISPLRAFVVQSISGGSTLTVKAKAKSVVMDLVPKTRTFEKVTRSQVVKEIAKEYNYDGELLHVDETKEVFEAIDQSHITDAQLLRKLAHLEGFRFRVGFDGLRWQARRMEQAPVKTFSYSRNEELPTIQDFTIRADIERAPGLVVVKGRDPVEMKNFAAKADNATEKDRTVLKPNLLVVGTFDGETGGLTRRVVRATAKSKRANIEQSHERTTNAQTQTQGQQEASSRFIRSQQNAVRMNLTVVGEPNVVAMSIVRVEGVGLRFSGLYYVRSVRHTWGSGVPLSVLDLSTDGVNDAGKKKGRNTRPISTLRDEAQACLADLNRLQSQSEDPNLTIALSEMTRGVQEFAQNPTPDGARWVQRKGISIINRFFSGGQNQNLVGPNERPSKVLRNCVALLRSYEDTEEEKANARVNEKPAKDASVFEDVATFDPETGRLRVDRRGVSDG